MVNTKIRLIKFFVAEDGEVLFFFLIISYIYFQRDFYVYMFQVYSIIVLTSVNITEWSSSIQSAKTRLRADGGWDHELLTAKFRLKLNKVEKTTIPFRYDLNQIPYEYTVEVRNRFKGLDLIDRGPDELRMEVPDIVQETDFTTIRKKRNAIKAK